ncbi:MAG: hypothetical protein A3E37_03145 [Candidatus Andersenbacteria bacterium RIFCSPHIGHO2_12_FULL_46_9]|nr:MAG: hypothetical protein A3B76_02025 [Candidatus Andersenbacteria bacterium RIFCSPHIGHO2_02_FULL_46_16]OGY37715.1 MAG: hypothetical protein A3E37_03145 [Candidatus Andersenbacteria bacterium RIFCSPHIGHO2_12_FULL_46_9]OGY37980.1 MAG: hypothetical protein A3I08_01830 [Candidatus Andersenbacteria bacterium RIFCSPLOWO2_02_FULL_46_11]OGY41506.1 MAG: hypothetical protein A3G57_00750 [Candidatus Andersenbacteria bacterium RIFCSPLOWO2_12_FULL_45_8]HBE90723.1 50S ribosomal protein L35 [Candidatus An
MKQKTNRAANKRFSFSSTGKARHQTINQSHFNAKDTGEETRRKHSGRLVKSADKANLHDLLPYQ